MAEETRFGEPDDSAPTPERQAELREAYEANVAAGKAPYAGVVIHTRGELQWVMRERGWSGEVAAGGKERANLCGAFLMGANLSRAFLVGANLSGAFLYGANLSGALLYSANLSSADLAGANLTGAPLEAANLSGAYLAGANLSGADLAGTNLTSTNLSRANLSGTTLAGANLSGAVIYMARMDVDTKLGGITLDIKTRLGDMVWSGVPLVLVDWTQVPRLGDEQAIAGATTRKERIEAYRYVVRAYRQLAAVLRDQGMNEEADYFAYRAQVLQRRVFGQQGKRGRQLLSWFLDLVAGYGYRPIRSVIAYVVIIGAFAGAYFLNTQFAAPHLRWDEALVLSISAFHGRGFFTTGISLGDTLARLAAVEAIIGLLIEITFIATFTQRFFAR